ncbi:uncharacterized protein [Watersipora subatra]|uniref:uncharacterized protein n=1 Tax=Watersipora subatra TaxID=2589382 RepID=UPI00355B13F5
MVVYTPDQALTQDKKGAFIDGGDVELQSEKIALTDGCGDEESTDNVYNETTVPVIRERRQSKDKRRFWLQLLLIAGMILGLAICVVGSIHLYRGMNYRGRYRGRCGVGVYDMTLFNSSQQQFTTPFYANKDFVKCGVIEDVDIYGPVETLTVPAQNKSSAATFRLDFDKNMTGIRDEILNLCFLTSFLDDFEATTVPQPYDFSFILSSRPSDADMPVVSEREEYFSLGPMVDDMLTEFGESLSELCSGATAYRIVSVPKPAFGDVIAVYDWAEDREAQATTLPTTVKPTTAAVEPTRPLDIWYKMYPGGDAIFNYYLSLEKRYFDDYDLGYGL